MIVKIEKNEIEAVKETCALSDFKIRFYSIESNPLMVQVEILEQNGDDLTNKDAWLLGRTIVWTLASKMI